MYKFTLYPIDNTPYKEFICNTLQEAIQWRQVLDECSTLNYSVSGYIPGDYIENGVYKHVAKC